MAERAMTREEMLHAARDMVAAAKADYRGRIFAAMRKAERLADDLIVGIGDASADEAYDAWRKAVVKDVLEFEMLDPVTPELSRRRDLAPAQLKPRAVKKRAKRAARQKARRG